MLVTIETHITCDFPGGSGPLVPPLWICICSSSDCIPERNFEKWVGVPWLINSGILSS